MKRYLSIVNVYREHIYLNIKQLHHQAFEMSYLSHQLRLFILFARFCLAHYMFIRLVKCMKYIYMYIYKQSFKHFNNK